MKIKEVMEKTGIPEKTIRYYESRGLIETATERRNGRTYHEFSQANVDALEQIILLRRARFSLEEIEIMQRNPEQLREIVRNYRLRMEQEANQLRQLTEARDLEQAKDWNELSYLLRRAFYTIPGYTPEVHFGRFDEEPEELRQAAIEAYHKKQEPGHGPLIAVIVILSLLCLILTGVLIYGARKAQRSLPEPTTATTGWVYYEYGGDLMRSREDGTEAELIYKQKNRGGGRPQYIVTELKIYILDDFELYSINADGSGEYQYPAEIGTAFVNQDIKITLFLLHEDAIYVSQVQGGDVGGNDSWVTRVPVDGSKQEKLDVDTSFWSYEYGTVWDGKLYLFGAYPETVSRDTPDLLIPAAMVYDLQADQIIATYDGELEAETDRERLGLYWGQGLGYISEGNTLLIVTPDDLQGQVVREFPGDILWASENHVLYDKNGSQLVLENMTTGAQTEVPIQANNYQFTESGLLAVCTRDRWELIGLP